MNLSLINGLLKISKTYSNLSVDTLKKKFNVKTSSKQTNSVISTKMLESEQITKSSLIFESLKLKTIQIDEKNKIRESMSFPAFKFCDVYKESWNDSKIKYFFENTIFCFFIFKKSNQENKFMGIYLWKIPNELILNNAKKIYELTRNVLIKGEIVKSKSENKWFTNFPGQNDDKYFHIRPHGRNTFDLYPLPIPDKITNSRFYMKQSFWLKNTFLEEVLLNFISNL